MPAPVKFQNASLNVINKKAFWNFYDHAGYLIGMNLLSLVLALTVFGLPLAFIGIYSVTAKIVNYEVIDFKDYWRHINRLWKRGVLLVIMIILGLSVLCINIFFYVHLLTAMSLSFTETLLFSCMLGLMIWLFIFFIIFTLYLFPVFCQLQTDIKATLKNSFFLMIHNLKISFYLFFSFIFLILVGLITGVVLLGLSLSLIAVIGNTAVREVLAQYHQPALDEKEEMRGFRDFIKPWGD